MPCPLPWQRISILPSVNSKCHYAVAAMVDRTDDVQIALLAGHTSPSGGSAKVGVGRTLTQNC